MRLLQTKVEEILSNNETAEVSNGQSDIKTGSPVRFEAPKQGHTATAWVPKDSRLPVKEAPRHTQNRFNENKELNLHKLSSLSQLASVSINDKGPLAETVKSLKE